MKKIYTLVITCCMFCVSHAQLTTTPNGGNKKAVVGERIGITDVTIHYDRPGVKGREGKIWGQLIQPGFADLGFGSSKAAPWRAGSNENTTIEFSTDIKIEGQPLAAGKYGFFIAYDSSESTLIFSKNSTSWGSFFYNEKEDALRVKVKPLAADKNVEWLKYEFINEAANSATVALEWEKLVIPFKVEVDLNATQIASFRNELRTNKGFMWESWSQAAQWCVDNNTNLDEALLWSDSATSTNFGGDKSFLAWSTKAEVLNKLGKTTEADSILKAALPYAGIFELHQYGRQLITQRKNKEALEVFQMNFKKNPNQFTTYVGLVRGYAANGDIKNATKYANLALPLAPDAGNKTNLETIIQKLKDGKDINQ